MELRDYQHQAIQSARKHFQSGKQSVLLVSPTGSGKTTIGTYIAAGHVQRGGRVLWIAHRRELISQAAERLRQANLDVAVWPYNGTSQVVVASVQGLLASQDKPLASMVILDEAHHYVSKGWAEEMAPYADCPKIGLTATPSRADGVGLGNAFDAMTVVTSIKELTEQGYLVPLDIVSPDHALTSKHIAKSPVDAYFAYAQNLRTVMFAPNLEMAYQWHNELLAQGVPSHVIHHLMSKQMRHLALTDHANTGALLINVGILTEGWDSPQTECIILARTCGSQAMYTQIAGRILRPHPSKRTALLVDLHGVCHKLGRPDEEKDYSLNGIGIRSRTASDVRYCVVCGAILDVDVDACSDCGYSSPDYQPPKVTNDPLVKFARKRAEGDDERVQTVAKWLMDVERNNYKYGVVFYKYKAVYGEVLSKEIFSEAHQLSCRLKKK